MKELDFQEKQGYNFVRDNALPDGGEMRAQWPRHLPKRFEAKLFLTVQQIAEIGRISDRAVQRFYIKEFPNAERMGKATNAQFAVPTSDVADFLIRVHTTKQSEPATPQP